MGRAPPGDYGYVQTPVMAAVSTELNTTLLAVLIFNSRLEPSWQRKNRQRT